MLKVLLLTAYADGLSVGDYIDSIKVVDFTGPPTMNASYKLVDVELSVQAYRLHGKESLKQTGYLGDVKAEKDDVTEEAWLAGAKVTTLPDKDLDGLWDSYVSLATIRVLDLNLYLG